jgi:hypothetical protein
MRSVVANEWTSLGAMRPLRPVDSEVTTTGALLLTYEVASPEASRAQ